VEATIAVILDTFSERGANAYGTEAVSQLEHALQSGQLALEASACDTLIVAALLHDIGHIIDGRDLPTGFDENFHDHHEERAYGWLLTHFGMAVAEPIRLHVAAKRYLCTVDETYESLLSPTSHKSYVDQGGRMSDTEIQAFSSEPFYTEALRLRRWDDIAKVPGKPTPAIEDFLPHFIACLQTTPGTRAEN